MKPGRKPPSTLEALLKWVLAAFFAVDLFLVAPAFAAGLGIELPRAFPRAELAALISGGSKLAGGLAQPIAIHAVDLDLRPPQAASRGSGGVISVYAPMVATPTPLPVDENEPRPASTEQETAATPAPEDPGAPSPTHNAEVSGTPAPSFAPSAVASLTSTAVFSPTPKATTYLSQTPIASSTWSSYASPTASPTRTKTKTATPPPSSPTPTSEPDSSYYVSPAGDDANPGTIAGPWRTLSRVNQTEFSPGAVVHFQRGGSWSAGLLIDNSGDKQHPITFTAYGEGPDPVLANPGHGNSVITIDADWIVVSHLAIRNTHEAGINVLQGSDHNVFAENDITDVGHGIRVAGQYNLITRNKIHDLHMIVSDDGGEDDYGAVGVVLHNSHNEVSYNTFLRCIAPAHEFEDDGGAVELYDWFGPVNDTYIHHNWASGNDGFLELGGKPGHFKDTVLAYNVSFNNEWMVLMNLGGKYGSDIADLVVENNTIVDTEGGWASLVFGDGEPTDGTLIVRNNIFYLEGFQFLANGSGFQHYDNLYFLSGTDLGYDPGSGEILGNPLFVDSRGGDFHLQSGSPAIDAGAPLGYSRDFDGHKVPNGDGPDLGAFEY